MLLLVGCLLQDLLSCTVPCCVSSGIMWEKKKRKRFQPIKTKYGVILEEGYQQYLNELMVSDGKTTVSGRIVIDKVEVCDY